MVRQEPRTLTVNLFGVAGFEGFGFLEFKGLGFCFWPSESLSALGLKGLGFSISGPAVRV